MELLSDADRRKLALITKTPDKRPSARLKEEQQKLEAQAAAVPFEEEPLKASDCRLCIAAVWRQKLNNSICKLQLEANSMYFNLFSSSLRDL